MGWTSFTIDKRQTIDQTLRHELSQDDHQGTRPRFEVIDSATVGAVWYAVFCRTTYDSDTPDGSTRATRKYFGTVVLTQRKTPKGSDRTEFFYKDMDEAMLPFHFDCPARLLDLLDKLDPNPEPAGGAYKWRARCRQRLAEKNQRNKERKQAHQQARARLQAFIRDHFKIIHIKA